MRALISRVLFAATLSTVAATACGYDPNPESGGLHCGPQNNNSCPEGYTCTTGRCWRDGGGGTGGGGGSSGGGGGSSGSVDKFIGHWTFTAASSMRVRVCPGVNETVKPWDDFFDIAAGGVSPLGTYYYCSWNLDVNAAGTATTLRAGTSCSAPDSSDPTTTFTWTGESFTLTTTNGTTGTLEASIPYTYVGPVSGSGSCTMHFTGPVTKS